MIDPGDGASLLFWNQCAPRAVSRVDPTLAKLVAGLLYKRANRVVDFESEAINRIIALLPGEGGLSPVNDSLPSRRPLIPGLRDCPRHDEAGRQGCAPPSGLHRVTRTVAVLLLYPLAN